MAYDGTTRLNLAVADLIGCSPKNNNKLAKVIGQAKNDLSINSKARKLPPETNLQIYSHLVELYSQDADLQPVEIISQDTKSVIPEQKTAPPILAKVISKPDKNNDVELYSQQKSTPEKEAPTPVEIISQENNAPVDQLDPATEKTDNFDNVRIAFYIMRKNKRERQVISLDGFFINALASINISKQGAPQWVQAQVNNWKAFDVQLPITRQVKYLIMLAVVKGLSGTDAVFHDQIAD